jgi:hypothetical protein
MKLFVWEGSGVLQDYTNGMIVAIAPDLQTALNAIEKECSYGMQSFPTNKPSSVVDLGAVEVEPRAWVCWGGG